MFAAENWCVKVDKKVYGPYSTQQMRNFVHEGRLAQWSLISPAGARAWREAREETTFANFFGYKRVGADSAAKKSFGRCEGQNSNGAYLEAHDYRDQRSYRLSKEKTAANFIIIFDTLSAAACRVEAAINCMGDAFKVANNVWSLKCELTAVGVRNVISPYLSDTEPVLVIDATRGRNSWQNFAPEAHAKLTAAYIAPLKRETVNAS